MLIDEPEGIRHITAKRLWHKFNGKHAHWTEPFEGDRYSIVAYRKPVPRSQALGQVASE